MGSTLGALGLAVCLTGPPSATAVARSRLTVGDGSTGSTPIYVCDRFGVRPCPTGAPLAFEAAWSELGATCVARLRIPDPLALDEFGERFPRLKGSLGPDACTEGRAARDPAALLYNRS